MNPETPPPRDPHGLTRQTRLQAAKKARHKARRFARNTPGHAERELNLTAMMDVLTILVVFLLKHFNTSAAAELREGLNPPVSNTRLEMVDTITVSVTRNDITVNDKKVLDLEAGRVRPADRTTPDQPLLIDALRDALNAEVAYHRQIQEWGGIEFKGEMLVVGDRSIDYALLSMILYTAGQAHLANFKFVTLSS